MKEGKVFSYGARYLGEYAERFLWDRRGYPVAFVEGACGGPIIPITEIPPIPSIPPIPPIPPITPVPPIPPIHHLSWSSMDFESFLSS